MAISRSRSTSTCCPCRSPNSSPEATMNPTNATLTVRPNGSAARSPISPVDAHVLIVEDNIQNFVLVARLMAFLGVKQCQWKASGWQVLEFADSMPQVDLILMDIHLPYEDGFEAMLRLRGEPRFRDTLIVAVTADASESTMSRAREAGFGI